MKTMTRLTFAGLMGICMLASGPSAEAGDRDDQMRRLRRGLYGGSFGVRISDDDDDDDCRRSVSRRYSSYRSPVYVPRYRTSSLYRSPSLYRGNDRGVSLSIGWGNGGLAVDTRRPRYVSVPRSPVVVTPAPVVVQPPTVVVPPTVLPPAPAPGPILHPPVTTSPLHAWGSVVTTPVPIYDRIRVKDLDETHPHSTKVMVAVKDPTPCNDPYATVYVPVCVPPSCGVKLKVRDGGARMEMDFGDYEVDITSCDGIVTLDYDD